MEHSPPTLQKVLTHVKQWTGSGGHWTGLREGNVRWSIVLGALPIIVFVAYALASPRATAPHSTPLAATPLPYRDQIKASYADASFDARFGDYQAPIRRVRTVVITRQEVAEVVHPPPVARPVEADEPRQKRTGDVCSRHNMRKVMVGRYRWRCRR